MSTNDPNKKFYFDPIGFEELGRVLKGRENTDLIFTVWCKGEENEQAEDFKLEGFNLEARRGFVEFQGGFLSKLTGSTHANKDVLIKIPDGKVFYFTTGHLHYDKIDKIYELELNGDVYCSRQRSNYRLMANQYNSIQFKINDVVYEGLDVSAGGTSILINIADRNVFAKDAVFDGCTLRFNRMNFDIPKARIAGAWEQRDSSGELLPEIKIGIAFESLTPGTEEALFKHINSEARMEEVRKRFG
jgi:hypothetical protein